MDLLQFHTLLYSALEEVSTEFDVPAALPRGKSPNYLFVIGLGVRHRAVLESLEKGKFLSPTEIHSTTARLHNHDLSYYTN